MKSPAIYRQSHLGAFRVAPLPIHTALSRQPFLQLLHPTPATAGAVPHSRGCSPSEGAEAAWRASAGPGSSVGAWRSSPEERPSLLAVAGSRAPAPLCGAAPQTPAPPAAGAALGSRCCSPRERAEAARRASAGSGPFVGESRSSREGPPSPPCGAGPPAPAVPAATAPHTPAPPAAGAALVRGSPCPCR